MPEAIRDLIEDIRPASILPESITEGKDLLSSVFSDRKVKVEMGDRVPAWWSRDRDKFLWKVMLNGDVISSAIFSTSARLAGIPISVVPMDSNNKRQRRLAMWSDALLQYYWTEISAQVALDWQTQDNGFFVEIMGAGDPSGPIEPTKIPGTGDYLFGTGLRVLDSQRATRTGDPTYPVKYLYEDKRGRTKEYKFHHSRVVFSSQMTSTREGMNGVGFCGVSRCIRSVLRLDDIDQVEGEKLGTRPASEIVFSKMITAEEMEDAFSEADEKMGAAWSQGDHSRMSRKVFVSLKGAADIVKAADIISIPLRSLPEGYNPEVDTNIAINIISMALGFDSREIWPATVRGATRADAEVQDTKSRRKTPGIWLDAILRGLSRKWVPNSTRMAHDQQDDQQDAMRAELRNKRAITAKTYLDGKVLDHQTVWEQFLEDGEISEVQFERLMAQRSRFEEMMNARESANADPVGETDGAAE